MELEGCTCERADNPYAHSRWTNAQGNGLRLDYLLYRPGIMLDGRSSKHPLQIECVERVSKLNEPN